MDVLATNPKSCSNQNSITVITRHVIDTLSNPLQRSTSLGTRDVVRKSYLDAASTTVADQSGIRVRSQLVWLRELADRISEFHRISRVPHPQPHQRSSTPTHSSQPQRSGECRTESWSQRRSCKEWGWRGAPSRPTRCP